MYTQVSSNGGTNTSGSISYKNGSWDTTYYNNGSGGGFTYPNLTSYGYNPKPEYSIKSVTFTVTITSMNWNNTYLRVEATNASGTSYIQNPVVGQSYTFTCNFNSSGTYRTHIYLSYGTWSKASSTQYVNATLSNVSWTYYETNVIGQGVTQSVPAPTLSSTSYKIGDVMYSGTDTCSNATYTANSTAKNGGSTAKNKGSFSFTVYGSNLISFPSTYTGTYVRPTSRKCLWIIKY